MSGSNAGTVAGVSVLVCSRDRRDMLDLLLTDLARQQYTGPVEIVVVEETSDPRPLAGVKYVPLPVQNRGIAYARNRALAEASHELLVYVDDDCRMEPDWLQTLLAPFADGEVLGAQGGVTVPEGTRVIGWAETLLGFPGGGLARVHRAAGETGETREVSTLNAAYRRAAVERASGFSDAARLGSEDYLLAKRVAESGRLLFVPDAMVRHAARGSLPAIWRWFVRRGRAEVDLLRAGIAPAGYGQHVLRASFGLKLAATLLTVPWLGWWLPVLLLLLTSVATCWRLRWALAEPEVPTAAFCAAPLVRLVMDLAADAGRLRQLLAGQEVA